MPTARDGRFVVLEHSWQGVHWDLMLESGEMLRTWALDSPPEPNRAIDARSLPDHRRMYLDYEGPISGDRGEVRQWDQGTFEMRLWSPDRVVVRLQGNQVIGEAELVCLGDPDELRWRFLMGKFI